MEILLTVIMTWLSSNFDLPAVHERPTVAFVTQQQMVSMRYGAVAPAQARDLVAIYQDRTGTIFLSKSWGARTPAELSVLVHEVVHHVQNVAKLKYPCPGAREALAYGAQEKWLSLFGRSLASEFGIDPMTLKIRTACM